MNNQLRVLHILESLKIGGAEILVRNLFEVNEGKSNVSLFLLYSNEGELKIDFYKITNRIKNQVRKSLVDIHYIKSIRNWVKEEKIDIIHTHQPLSSFYSILATLGLGTKIVLSHHGFYNDRKTRLLLCFIKNFIDSNISVSNSFVEIGKTKFKYFKKLKFTTIYNGISIKTKPYDNDIGAKLGFSKQDILIGMVGNFTSDKIYYSEFKRDHLTVCKAIKILKDDYPNIKMLFVGRKVGRSYQDCFDYCNHNSLLNNVYFLGERNDVHDIIRNIDLAVYSSLGDTFGITVAEYMIAGVVTIINDHPVMKEISGEGKYSILFKSEDFADLADKILKALAFGNAQKNEIIEKARNWAVSNFNIELNLQSTFKIYNNLFH